MSGPPEMGGVEADAQALSILRQHIQDDGAATQIASRCELPAPTSFSSSSITEGGVSGRMRSRAWTTRARPAVEAGAFVAAGMKDDEFRAQQSAALQRPRQEGYRFFPDDLVGGCEVDEIGRMQHDGIEIVCRGGSLAKAA